jgi:hypothetical protein
MCKKYHFCIEKYIDCLIRIEFIMKQIKYKFSDKNKGVFTKKSRTPLFLFLSKNTELLIFTRGVAKQNQCGEVEQRLKNRNKK